MAEFKGFSGNTEAQLRQWVSYLFAQDSAGIASDGVLSGLAVAQTTTASGSVLVGLGAAVVQDSLTNGAVPLVSNASKTLDVLGPNPMGATPRNDIVVFDSATSSIRNIVGTPNASPTDPTVPATAVALARLRHAASATTIPSSKIDDLRTFTGSAAPVVPMWRGYASVTQPKIEGAIAGVTLTEDYAVGGSFASAGLSSIRTLPRAGYYDIRARVTWPADPDGYRSLELRKNVTGTDLTTGTMLDRDQREGASQLISNFASARAAFNAGDRVSIGCVQTSGGNLDIIYTSYQTWLEIAYVRPL